ncbi:FRG domain-containing protein [Acinetobacter baumannii]|uniref:FRG domain-containing protein n=1 Tax=Acinetobacter baumannii TaxID=470 RepID=UPI001EFE6169|nr:FRG domain-containing protein [Acinetobacter baumannii]MCG9247090.1 FRG domain-containing protein [Acinetobacter baumannii]MCG9268632.1 FRG domain-containing protein [Acinetobacter baumannii]
MDNNYFQKVVFKETHYELEFTDFEEFISFMRPDKLNVKNVMTHLRHTHEPSTFSHKKFGTFTFKSFHVLDKSIVYRGHGESEWDLIPTFYREEPKYNWKPINKEFDLQYESEILTKFQEACDLAGVQLPSDNDQLRRRQKNKISNFFGKTPRDSLDWFSDDFYELAVFAQHYGASTRLLDWTKNPYVACYFACSHALSLKFLSEKKISIWILNSENIINELNQVLEVLDPPKGLNQHISHQQGILTYTKFNQKVFEELGCRPSLKDILKLYNSSHRLLKINIGFDLVPEIFSYCNAHNFNACHLFRGAIGAGRHTKDLINIEKFYSGFD